MGQFNWQKLILEGVNIIFALGFMILFAFRIKGLGKYSQSNRFSYINPYGRLTFILIFIAGNISQFAYYVYSVSKLSEQDSESDLTYMLGTLMNSIVLGFQLYVMNQEIKRQRPYSPIHAAYMIYLPLVTFARMIQTIILGEQLPNIIISSCIFTDAFALSIYSLFYKRQQIELFRDYALFRFDHLQQLLQNQPLLRLGSMQRSRQQFSRLTVNADMVQYSRIGLKVYYRKQEVCKNVYLQEDLERFYGAAKIFNLKSQLDFQHALTVKDIKTYLDELLANPANYQPFVLDFLNVEPPFREQILHNVESLNMNMGNSVIEATDPSCIFFSVAIWKAVKVRDHLQFFFNIETQDRKHRRQMNKRFAQFEELDKRLRSLQVRFGGNFIKLKPPQLPDKYYFGMSGQDFDQRMSKLEEYSRRLLNDRVFIKRYPQLRDAVYSFFNLEDICQQVSQKPFSLHNLSCIKGHILTRMSQKGQPSIVYGMTVRQNGINLYQISKRYSEFCEFNKEFRRWCWNNLEPRQFPFPPKMITLNQRQKQQRHHELATYLNTVMKIPHIDQLYEFRVLLQSPMNSQRTKQLTIRRQETMRRDTKGIKPSSQKQLQDMSDLIQDLGKDSMYVV